MTMVLKLVANFKTSTVSYLVFLIIKLWLRFDKDFNLSLSILNIKIYIKSDLNQVSNMNMKHKTVFCLLRRLF